MKKERETINKNQEENNTIYEIQNTLGRKEDGRGVNGSHTDLFPGPIWNYNSIVEKPPGTNN